MVRLEGAIALTLTLTLACWTLAGSGDVLWAGLGIQMRLVLGGRRWQGCGTERLIRM
jgi:hypothetical protein